MIKQAHGRNVQFAKAVKLIPAPTRFPCVHSPQRGAIAIMVGVLLPVILGILGLSLETAQLYNRKVEMQSAADAIAISAARQLDGTPEGITNAFAAALDVVENGHPWTKIKYGYHRPMTFSEAAVRFGRSSDGSAGWLDAGAAKASPEGLAYVQVATDRLGSYGTVDLLLMPVLSTLTSVEVGHTTIAGRRRLNATPLAICAMPTNPANPVHARDNGAGFSELTEYGFRRGVSYNLLNLNPNAETPANYLVDPISLPPKSYASNFAIANVGQYVCTGTVELPGLVGKTVNVQKDFPIGSLANHLNSRFDASKRDCSPSSAPPDSNIKPYTISTNSWMSKPMSQVAEPTPPGTPLRTIADLPPPNDQAPTHYGPLWVFARPVPWASAMQDKPEPLKGYTPFPATNATWKGLYSTGPSMNSYPSGTTGLLSPYFTQVTAPSVSPPGIQFRRVLNVPLLECPVSGSQGRVLAIGKFFMTVPADAKGIYAEFAGVAPREEFAGPVELYK